MAKNQSKHSGAKQPDVPSREQGSDFSFFQGESQKRIITQDIWISSISTKNFSTYLRKSLMTFSCSHSPQICGSFVVIHHKNPQIVGYPPKLW